MKRLHRLDFMGSPAAPVTGWALAALSAVTLAVVASQLWSLDADTRRLASSLRKTDLTLAAANAPTQRDALVRVQAPLQRPVATLPWSDVLAVFDAHANARIGLMRFEPDANEPGRVRVTAQARDKDTMTTFLRDLERDGRLSNVTLADQQLQESGSGRVERAISFTVLAAWRGEPSARLRTLGTQ